ncbi:uncharacterized protein DNG_06264 [Cephalotrichum gorgonifer]|uniref:Uncharacterized protein n=1 Tax=Cephalotrichum gorgonifer TaxID=2041049 RepID=A0AAE8MZG1_9PEZI|nr:uncharacterized protein DNG_06264 [Cephalotrichum gorgonifer]
MKTHVTSSPIPDGNSGGRITRHRALPTSSLGDKHREAFRQAMVNVLSTDIAVTTFAEIIHGLPLFDTANDTYYRIYWPSQPLVRESRRLSTYVLEKARRLANFDTRELLNTYQITAPGSKAFQTRLVELTAVTVHQLAVSLFKSGPCRSKEGELGGWRMPQEVLDTYGDHLPTAFVHMWYLDFDQYPEGVADAVGYWAESRIFGGVVLFDRRKIGPKGKGGPDAIYLHADRRDVMYRIYKLLDRQRQQLVQFLLAKGTPSQEECPIPVLGDINNRQRVDPEEPLEETGIYRDLWERRPRQYADCRTKDVVDIFNYLSVEDWEEAHSRGYDLLDIDMRRC